MIHLESRRRAGRVTAALLAAALPAAAEQTIGKSPWGPEDEIGAANRLRPELVLKARDLVTTGRVYPLGIETNADTPAFPPRGFKLYVVQPGQAYGQTLPSGLNYNDDIVEGWLGIGSQLDGLGHIGHEGVFYNRFEGHDFADITGLTRLGIEKVPPIVTRGVLLDMTRVFDVERLAAGTAINRAEIEAAMRGQGVQVREGDVVLLHTGWLQMLQRDPATFAKAEPGLGLEGARFLASKGIIAVGADSWGVEVVPFETEGDPFHAHRILLAENGIYLLENMNTAALAADGVHEFMFVLGQPRITGAVQMIINPVAID